MNNILSKRKSTCLSVVGDCPFHFRAEMNENVGGNWKKRRHVFFKFVQKILEFVQKILESVQKNFFSLDKFQDRRLRYSYSFNKYLRKPFLYFLLVLREVAGC